MFDRRRARVFAGVAFLVLWSVHFACAPAAPPPPDRGPDVGALFGAPDSGADAGESGEGSAGDAGTGDAGEAQSATPTCQSDDDCGYDPTSGRCGADPRFNKQPPVLDQGLICYCDADTRACGLLRVEPVPCEGEPSCAIRLDPRPHPVRATPERPYQKPRPCRPPKAKDPRRTDLFTTCERTNICTMHLRECASP